MFGRRLARVGIAGVAKILAPSAALLLALTLQAPPLSDYVEARVRQDVRATRGTIGGIATALGRHLGDSSLAIFARAALASANGEGSDGVHHHCSRSG